MSKKHFIALADTLRDIRNQAESALTTGEVMQIVERELCRFCKSQNGAFDYGRFLDYSKGLCGPNGGRKLT